jgi:hypothetical protein
MSCGGIGERGQLDLAEPASFPFGGIRPPGLRIAVSATSSHGTGMLSRPLRRSLWFIVAATASISSAASGQEQTPRIPVTAVLDSAGGLAFGVSAGRVIGAGEAFSGVRAGFGLQMFVGVPFAAVDELRLGGGWTQHDDDVSDEPVVFRSVYLETYWAITRSPRLVLRIAPRLAWFEQSRAMYPRKLSEFGFGGVVGARMRLGSRFSLEPTVGLTGVTFNTADFRDADLTQAGWMWEFRLAAACSIL